MDIRRRVALAAVAASLVVGTAVNTAQEAAAVPASRILDVAGGQIRVVTVATGLFHPWSLAFLPDGSLLVAERDGRLRIIRNGG